LRLPFFENILYLDWHFISRFPSPWTCHILFRSAVLSEWDHWESKRKMIVNYKLQKCKGKNNFFSQCLLIFLKVQRKIAKFFQDKDFWAKNLTCIFRKRSRTTRPLRTTYDHFKMVFWAITPNSVTVKRRQYVASKRQNEIIIQYSATTQSSVRHETLKTYNDQSFLFRGESQIF
jgi:hypothetical protein